MRLTIIPADKFVSINGIGKSPLDFYIDSSIHAVQWYGNDGEIEFITDKNGKPPNQHITDISQFQNIIDIWNNSIENEESDNNSSTYITQITMRQARLLLYHQGLLQQIENIILQSSIPVQIEWEYSTIVERESPLVKEIITYLNFTEEQVNDLFLQASKL